MMFASTKHVQPYSLLLATTIAVGNLSVAFAYDVSAPVQNNQSSQTAAPASDTKSNTTGTAQTSSDTKQTTDTATTTTTPGATWRPGMELSVGTDTQDLVPTDDAELARKQVQAYPDSPEASFILAVALTRTSKVEEALKEVRRARKLAEQQGGAPYFDKMIATYEDMLKNFPNENRVRYGLAWAYYMKAYLLANYSKKVAAWKAKNGDPEKVLAQMQKGDTKSGAGPNNTADSKSAVGTNNTADSKSGVGTDNTADSHKTGDTNSPLAKIPGSGNTNTANANAKPSSNPNNNDALQAANAAKTAIQSAVQPGKPLDINGILGAVGQIAQGNTSSLKVPSITDNVDPQDLPQIRKYYEQALNKLDDLLAQKPDDVWALVYRAHLKAEYTGNLDEAMQTWTQCREKFPNNPAAYFFLGEGYLKQGNLKESLNNVSKAVALRAMGF